MYLPSLPPVMLLLDSSDIVGTDGRWGVADPYETIIPRYTFINISAIYTEILFG